MSLPDQSESDFDPRHRIVGAVVVVSLLVVLAPLVLNKQHLAEESAPVAAGSRIVVTSVREMDARLKDQAGSVAPGMNTGQTGEAQAEAAGAPTDVASSGAEGVVPQPKLLPAPKPLVSTGPDTGKPVAVKERAGSQPKPATSSSRAVVADGWVVQVGTYANRDNARRLEKRLKGKGYQVMLESVRLQQGEALRVRVGPYGDKSSASSASDRIQRELGLKGVVLAAK